MTSAEVSIIPEFREKVELMDMTELFEVTKGTIINKRSKSEIIFKGIQTSSGDQTANLKSLQGITTWVLDEAEELKDEAKFDKIDLSIRQKGVQNRVIIILNPTTKEHFIYRRFFENMGVEPTFTGQKGNVTYIHSTYLDNLENLDQSFIDIIERMQTENPQKYEHQIMGGWLAKAEGVVFDNWELGEFNNDLPYIFGQDFGFSIDPTTLFQVAIDRKSKKIHLRELIYKAKLVTSEIAEHNQQYAGNKLIVADSSEPRLIEELKARGNNIIATEKGAGSVSAGIALMQDYKLIVTPDSINLIKELNNYAWSDKKSGVPIDMYNHAIDAIRYAVFYQLANPSKGKYFYG
jgi:phage terminase large subunit